MSFRECRWCSNPIDPGPWPACSRCRGTGIVSIWTAIGQYFDFSLYTLAQYSYRLFGKCHTKWCFRRPKWRHGAMNTYSHFRGLRCDKHVVRGCCYPYGTTICADWGKLPLYLGDLGEEDPVERREADQRQDELLRTLPVKNYQENE